MIWADHTNGIGILGEIGGLGFLLIDQPQPRLKSCIQRIRIRFNQLRAGGRRVHRHHLPDHEPIEQVADRGEVLLGRGRRPLAVQPENAD